MVLYESEILWTFKKRLAQCLSEKFLEEFMNRVSVLTLGNGENAINKELVSVTDRHNKRNCEKEDNVQGRIGL